jgi:hypothetical protein
MRLRAAALVIVGVATACTRAPVSIPAAPVSLSLRPVASNITPSPLVEVRVGDVEGVFPSAWEARMVSTDHYPRQGFVASPRIDDWERGAEGVPGIEAFWVDVARLGISSEYYYLAARNASFGQIPEGERCTVPRSQVFANHPPDLTGATFSPSDYVASARGRCLTADGTAMRWAYVVAAPGFGPARGIGIPSSGLYVVMAEVSGPNAEYILKEMLQRARFGNATLMQVLQAAGGGQLR